MFDHTRSRLNNTRSKLIFNLIIYFNLSIIHTIILLRYITIIYIKNKRNEQAKIIFHIKYINYIKYINFQQTSAVLSIFIHKTQNSKQERERQEERVLSYLLFIVIEN